MIKYCFKWSALFLVVGFLIEGVTAQSAATLRKLNARYDNIQAFEDGIAVVVKKGKKGYVDTLGREVVPPVYDQAMDFHNGFAVVAKGKSGEYRCALIDREGRELTPFDWDDMENMDSGIAVAYNDLPDGKRAYSLIDTAGNIRPLKYDFCRGFANGYAVVGTGDYAEEEVQFVARKRKVFTGKHGYITPDGELAIPIRFDDAGDFDEMGMAPVGEQAKYYVKWGFIDNTGKLVVPYTYYSVEHFRHERALVCKVAAGNKLVYGFIDRNGDEVIPCEFDTASSFLFPNTWVGVLRDDDDYDYTLININGDAIMPFMVRSLQPGGKYGNVVAALPDDNGELKYGIISNQGRVVLPFEYDDISIFSEWDTTNNRWQEGVMATKNGQRFSFNIMERK
ncbi:WG repeat-containing protein [uncultured Alistipes sp.]|jgi:hypothetical protein|uniref:WG repeat-containing protein n=1 Tax=uncultured Alistipes sp. TaxID=538949 RepID=UPI0025CDFA04|nr:WG repeat-containing protein [uncultured Alistipes sp.]